jgi:hypothetical protein
MAAPRNYPDELRGRATRMAVEARLDPVTRPGSLVRVTGQHRPRGEAGQLEGAVGHAGPCEVVRADVQHQCRQLLRRVERERQAE